MNLADAPSIKDQIKKLQATVKDLEAHRDEDMKKLKDMPDLDTMNRLQETNGKLEEYKK